MTVTRQISDIRELEHNNKSISCKRFVRMWMCV